MGAGSSPAGSGPAGADPIQSGTPSNRVSPTAIRYEGATKDFALDAVGNYRFVHPVDQAVALGMMARQGQLKSSPTVGNTLDKITYLTGPNLQSNVENRVRTANPIAALLADGSISIDKIVTSTDGGRLVAILYYRNLKLDPNRVMAAPTAS